MPPIPDPRNKKYQTVYYTTLFAHYSEQDHKFRMYICEPCVQKEDYRTEWIDGVESTKMFKARTEPSICDFCHQTLPILLKEDANG